MKILSDAQLAELLDQDIFHKIGDAADALGVPCYVVGGYVRDLFLERASNDIDVVVVGSGIQVADALEREKKVTATTRASLSWRTERWKTTKTAATLPSTLWPFALTPRTSGSL